MTPFVKHTGVAVPLDRPDVDTDQIIPKQFLKRVERTGFGAFLFNDWRFRPDGTPDPGFVLNEDRYREATVLVAGRNFGCGSSREHAPWALADYGFRAVIAPSFADIFASNCVKNGILPVVLPEPDFDVHTNRTRSTEGYAITVDLQACEVFDEQGFRSSFAIGEFARRCLLHGLDEIGLTLEHRDAIDRFEATLPSYR
jgi:3-isopropylmalate/(R)-2-methylmalate dehydratase small subunit